MLNVPVFIVSFSISKWDQTMNSVVLVLKVAEWITPKLAPKTCAIVSKKDRFVTRGFYTRCGMRQDMVHMVLLGG